MKVVPFRKANCQFLIVNYKNLSDKKAVLTINYTSQMQKSVFCLVVQIIVRKFAAERDVDLCLTILS